MYRKTWPRFFLVLFLALLMGGYMYYNKMKLKQCNYDGMAVIYDIKKHYSIEKKKDRGYFLEYQYKVDGEVYKSSEGIGYSEERKANYSVGDSIEILIGCDDPSLVDVKKKGRKEEEGG